MKRVAVAPFRASAADVDAADAADLAELICADAARTLGAVAPSLAELVLSADVSLHEDELVVVARLGDAPLAEERWPIGLAPQAGAALARSVRLVLGEELPAQPLDPAAPSGVVRRYARARHDLVSDPDEGADELVELAAELPAAARALIDAARDGQGGPQMPILFAALERLVEVRPDDAEVLIAAAEYRALHLDEGGARTLLLTAREIAPDDATKARALGALAALAESAARADEAIAHLRNAIRLADDPDLFARLGRLLEPRDRGEALRMWSRAAVLAPDDADVHAAIARLRPR